MKQLSRLDDLSSVSIMEEVRQTGNQTPTKELKMKSIVQRQMEACKFKVEEYRGFLAFYSEDQDEAIERIEKLIRSVESLPPKEQNQFAQEMQSAYFTIDEDFIIFWKDIKKV